MLTGSHLLVATGRVPNTERLNLVAAGLKADAHGLIPVNERPETAVLGIFALGDIKGGPAFTHIAYDDFRILRTNLLEGGGATTTDRLVPYTVFMDPQLGRVGLTERKAREQGMEGGEIATLLQVAMMGGLTAATLRETVFAHPTLSESLNNLFTVWTSPRPSRGPLRTSGRRSGSECQSSQFTLSWRAAVINLTPGSPRASLRSRSPSLPGRPRTRYGNLPTSAARRSGAA